MNLPSEKLDYNDARAYQVWLWQSRHRSFEDKNINKNELNYLKERISKELMNHDNLEVISEYPKNDMAKTPEGNQHTDNTSCQSEDCFIEMGHNLKCDKILIVSFSERRNILLINLKLLDIAKKDFEASEHIPVHNKRILSEVSMEPLSSLIKKEYSKDEFTDIFLIELELGWNSSVGLGARLDIPITEHISWNIGAGTGNWWGTRLSASMRYYFDFPPEKKLPYSNALSIGSTLNLGNSPNHKSVPVLNISVIRNFRLPSVSVKVYTEVGYSIPLVKNFYVNKDLLYGYDDEDKKREPGGFILSAGIAW